MNVFSYLLAKENIDSSPDKASNKFTVDDNIGEAVHIHYRNLRQEMSVDDFRLYTEEMARGLERLENGDN